jgi:hypothetical protein
MSTQRDRVQDHNGRQALRLLGIFPHPDDETFRIRPEMFPLPTLKKLLGSEYFVQAFPAKVMATELLPEAQRHSPGQ